MDRYDEYYRTHRIEKVRQENESNNEDSVHYVAESDLEEQIIKYSFLLNEVIGWESFTNPIGVFKYKGSMTLLTSVNYRGMILLVDFEEFDKVMKSFIAKQNALYFTIYKIPLEQIELIQNG